MRRAGVGSDERLLAAMADHMHLFKQLLDTSTEAEMNELAKTYPAFGRLDRPYPGRLLLCAERSHTFLLSNGSEPG
jgi:hypothetical protein